MIIAIIPARSGSVRIPHKNVRLFFGRPIIAYSIETARATGLFEEIIVSTDSYDYAAAVIALGAMVHMRGPELSSPDIGTQEIARAVLIHWQQHHGGKLPELACCIYATAPMMTAMDLRLGWRAMHARQPTDFAYSVGLNPLRDAAQFYWGTPEAFITRRPLDQHSIRVGKIVVSDDRVCDINTEEDWQRAEAMYQALQEDRIEEEQRL